MKGLVHSIDTFSTLDGPGIRTVIFMQGCHLRCKYCHNPDTWALKSKDAKEYSVDELMHIIIRAKPYFRASQGGVTFSGGEPLLQSKFIQKVLHECKLAGIHTCIDSALYVKSTFLEDILPYTDLVLADIKHIDSSKSKHITSMPNKLNLENLKLISTSGIPIWIRYVVIPDLTDDEEDIVKMAHFIKNLKGVERIDLLPYHFLGKHKWDLLNLKYELEDTEPPSLESLEYFRKIIETITNIKVYYQEPS